MARQTRKPSDHSQTGDREQSRAGRFCLHVEAENVLEIGQAVVAAKAEIVAKKSEHQRVGQRLGDDRQIDAGDAAAKREPAEHEGEHARHQHDHEQRVGKMLEAVPGDRQFLPVQEHHEIRQDRIGVNAAGADLPHQIHAHGVAAEREERAVAERENAAKPPYQIDRQGEQRVAGVFAEQRHQVGRQVKCRRRRDGEVQKRHDDCDRRHRGEEKC